MTDIPDRPSRRNFYGRRSGKTLKLSHRRFLSEDLHTLALRGVTSDQNPSRSPIDPAAVFGPGREIWLEVGFGGGEHLVHQASLNPDAGLIGCEPFINGVAALLGRVRRAGVDNLRIHPGDVRDLFDVLPDGTLDRVFLLYPDPWPKTRHRRRRFVTPQYLLPLARVMRPGATLRIATDIPDFVRQTLDTVPAAGFERIDAGPQTLHIPWDDWLPTRYEEKALREGRTPHYLTFRRSA